MQDVEFLELADVLEIHADQIRNYGGATGTVSALVFLDWNGVQISAEPGELSDMTIAVASSQMDKTQVAMFFESHARGQTH